MGTFRYDTNGQWFKGNVHIHSTASDGGKAPGEIAEMYASAGYDFLCRTDHWVASDVASEGDDAPLLWLDGMELDGQDDRGSSYHVICLGRFEGIDRERGFAAGLAAAREQGGLLTLAHPHWCGNSLEDAFCHDFDGVEVYNHVCQWLNGKGHGGPYWTAMLGRSPGTLSFAVDDAHLLEEHPGWNGGWIMVNAPAVTREDLAAAIRAGRFYSTRGPVFHSIEWDGDRVAITMSPVFFARLVGPAWRGERVGSFNGETVTEAVFEIPPDWDWAYLEVEDAHGRRAWTNTLFAQAQ